VVRLRPDSLLPLSPGHALCPSIPGVIFQRKNPALARPGSGFEPPSLHKTPPRPRARGRGISGGHPGCGPGAALNTEGTLGCEVRLLCPPPSRPRSLSFSRNLGKRIGRGPSLLRRQCAPPRGVWGSRPPLSATHFFAAGARGRATCLVNRDVSVRFRSAAPRCSSMAAGWIGETRFFGDRPRAGWRSLKPQVVVRVHVPEPP
jgi:hypothetical protein